MSSSSRVELARIPALTFYKDSLTESRRTSPIPQLICVGKPCKLYTPEVVRCESLGGVGTEIEWKCQADLPDSLRFGRVEVSCEGYSRPGDAYVLKGSCSLEYRLVQVPGALRDSDSDNWSGSQSSDVASTIFTVIWVAVAAIIVYSFYRSCMRPENRVGGQPGAGRPGGNLGPTPGFFPGGFNNDDASAPPPYSKSAPAPNEGWRPGFWTGAMLGGLGAHFLGNNNNRQNQRAYDWERERTHGYRPPASGGMFGQRRSSARYSSDDRGEGSSNLGSMRQSTGFGGSNVR